MRVVLLLLCCCLNGLLFAQLTCDDEYALVGDATVDGTCFEMTTETAGQSGCAWFLTEQDFSMPFTVSAGLSFGDMEDGADGICLVFQTDSPGACGGTGQGIGADGINNSFIIEFDTWDNGAGLGDIPNDHMAVNINGDMTSPIEGPVDLGNIEDGNEYTVTFSWDPTTMTFDVSLGSGSITGVFDIVNNCFNGETLAYWGFTSSTGGAVNRHEVCPGLPEQPFADAEGNLTSFAIPCVGATIELDGSNSDQGSDFLYLWETLDGNIVSGATSLHPIVDEPGTYTLTVLNTDTNCETLADVIITQEVLVADIVDPDDIDCDLGEVVLDGSGSTQGENVFYDWSTIDGNIIDFSEDMATIDAEGTYTLTVTYDDGTSTCVEMVSVFVNAPQNPPLAVAQGGDLFCIPTTLELDGTGSTDDGVFSFQWFTLDGTIVSGSNTLFPEVDQPGTYTLVVTNTESLCTDEVDVEVIDRREEPTAVAIADQTLGCGNSSVTIDGTLSSDGPNVGYRWTTADGNILGGETTNQAVVDQPGTYVLTVTYTDTGCSSEAEAIVSGSTDDVVAEIAPPNVIDCNMTTATLLATVPADPTNIVYAWSTTDGQLIGATNESTATAGESGTYTLTVTNTVLNCSDVDMVTVVDNRVDPTAEAGIAPPFNCGDITVQLNGSSPGNMGNVIYAWSTTNGSIVSGANAPVAEVGGVGIYTLTVTRTDNGCSATDQVEVISGGGTPDAEARALDVIDCRTSRVTLVSQGSSTGVNIVYQWSTTDGQLIGGNQGSSALAGAGGTYMLLVQDTVSGCSNTTSVMVESFTTPPVAEAGVGPLFRCGDITQQLNGEGSSTGQNLVYAWSTSNGGIQSGGNTLMPIITSSGDYTLVVTDTLRGCTSMDQVTVMGDADEPIVTIALSDTLNCQNETVQLNATGSSVGTDFVLSWSAGAGNIVSGADGLQPVVDQGGIYILSIMDTTNNCTNMSSVTVVLDTLTPESQVAAVDVLNCTLTEVALMVASPDSNLQYQWTSPTNQIVNDTMLMTTQAGDHTLQVFNPVNRCADTLIVAVAQDTLQPVLTLDMPDTLTCAVEQVALQSNITNGGTVDYLWQTTDGNIVGAVDRPTAQADGAGTYSLVAINTGNTCSDTATLVVAQSTNLPLADAGLNQTIDCAATTINLGDPNAEPNHQYRWTRLNGEVVDSTESTLSATIPDTYILAVTDLSNSCQQMDTVVVDDNRIDPIAAIAPPALITCTDTIATLDASMSQGQGPLTFQWGTVDGSLRGDVSIAMAEATQQGSYQVVVVDASNGCADSTIVQVRQDENFPVANIAFPDTLNCDRTSLSLDGIIGGSTTLDFSWQTNNGNVVQDGNTLQPLIDAPGTYELQVEDLSNNCRTSVSVVVIEDVLPPTVNAGLPQEINCFTPTTQLQGQTDNNSDPLSYQWTTNGGNFITSTDIVSPDIDAAGDYQLRITNLRNGCRDSAIVVITEDFVTPQISVVAPAELTCERRTVNLDASASGQAATLEYRWTDPSDASFIDDNPAVSLAGDYQLVLFDTDNGCSDTTVVTVAQSIILPIVATPAVSPITCDSLELSLSSEGSDLGGDYTYIWRTDDGQILSGADSQSARIGTAGTYTLVITNTINSCQDSSAVVVTTDNALPLIDLVETVTLDCREQSYIAQPTFQSLGTNPTYIWTSADGTIDTDPSQPELTIGNAGTYVLTVENTENGCTETATIAVDSDQAPPMLNIPLAGILNCSVLTQELTVESDQTLTADGYVWTTVDGQIQGGTTAPNAIAVAPGEYYLTAISARNGCEGSTSLTVLQDTTSAQINIATPIVLDCRNDEQVLAATITNTIANPVFSWTTNDGQLSDGVTTGMPTISAAGTYSVQVVNMDNFCPSEASISVEANTTAPNAVIAPPTALTCVEEDVVLDASASTGQATLSYSWTTINGNILSGEDSELAQVDRAGGYILIVEDSANGCTVSEAIQVTEDRTLPIVDAGTDLLLACDEESTALDGSGTAQGDIYTYEWTSIDGHTIEAATSLNPSVGTTGIYQLAVTNTNNGCVSIDEVLVGQDTPLATTEVINPRCFGDPGTIFVAPPTGGMPPYVYSVNDGESFQTQNLFSALQAGAYELVVEDANGCQYTESIVLAEPAPLEISFPKDEYELTIGDSLLLPTNSTWILDETASISWEQDGTLSCNDCLTPIARPLRTTAYRVTVLTEEGCSDDAIIRILIRKDRPIYFPTAFSPNNDGDNDLFFPFARAGVIENINSLRVYSRWGNTVFEAKDMQPNDPSLGWDGYFQGELLNPAVFVYVAEVTFTDGVTEVLSGDILLIR